MLKKSNTEYPVDQYPFRVRNWEKFQHFRDRRPPWIKLYRDVLDDLNYHALDDSAARVLFLLWLLASETEGYLPDINLISFRLRMSPQKISTAITSLCGFIDQLDIKAISSWHQDDTPEREREVEKEKEEVSKEVRASSLRSEGAPPADEPLSEAPFDLDDNIPIVPVPPKSQDSTKTPKAMLFARGKSLVGPRSGAMLSRLIKLMGEEYPRLNRVLDLAEASSDPAAYVFGAITKAQKKLKQDELDSQQLAQWKPRGSSYPEADERGFYVKSAVDGNRRLYLDPEIVQKLVGAERERRGTI